MSPKPLKQWQLFEEHFNQADLGGEASKPTTAAGDLPLKLQPHLTKRKKYVSQRVHDSKSLSRWSCGFMNAVAQKHFWRRFSRRSRSSSSRPFLGNNMFKMVTFPYDRNCLTCQQTLQMQLPHRRVSQPKGGVLSLDTTGPFKQAPDGDRTVAKFLLVGAFTWTFPKTSASKERLDDEPDLPPDALELPEEVEDQEDPTGRFGT